MGMMRVKAFLIGSDLKATEEVIEFQLDDDLVEMVYNEKFYFEKDDRGFLSEIVIDGKVYVDIQRSNSKTQNIAAYLP